MDCGYDRLQEEHAGVHARFSGSHRSLSESRHQSIDFCSRLESTQLRVIGIVETNAALAAQKTTLTAEEAALTAAKTELIGENAALAAANTTLATAIAGLAEEKAALTTGKIAFTTALAALKDLNAKLHATNVDLSRENAALGAEHDQLRGIQESLSWRLIQKCKAIRKRSLREGTMSERCWILFSRFAKTAIRQGLYAACQSAAREIKHKSEDLVRRGTQAVIAGPTRRSQSAVRFLGLASSQGIRTALGRAANTGQNTIEVEARDSIQSPVIRPESPEVVCDYFDPRPVVDRYDAWRDRNRDNGRRRRRFDRVLPRMSPGPYFRRFSRFDRTSFRYVAGPRGFRYWR
jgi:hypothetical protein